ncbi:GNAT family N-acetyltransferase [Nocardia sp. AG03]|uniref:GNAT family N-acetyltransferase n=1 Tax=Nocardia sp. AG03 TaxID=3025312 RepID=UPI002418B0B8|nr:GNAT family N-acetyltransferase [Nocardia sp. AG03]
MPRAGIGAVADALIALDGPLTSVEGPAEAVDAFVAHWSSRTGGTHRAEYTARLYALATSRPASAPGRPRRAEAADLDWCLRMIQDFAVETEAVRGFSRAVAERKIEAGMWWLWERDGVPSAFVARQIEAFGWVRIGPVYTPPAMRGNGYASALTGAVSAAILAEGAEVCLFADVADPTSNKIYRVIGFEPVCDFTHHRLVPA